jgi:hypothetical protein
VNVVCNSYILSYYLAVFEEPEFTCFFSASFAGGAISATSFSAFDHRGYQLANTTFYFPTDGTQEALLEFRVECDKGGFPIIGLDDVSLINA